METNSTKGQATVKMVQLIEKIENEKGIKFNGVKWKFEDAQEFLNKNLEPSQKQIDFVRKLEQQTNVKFTGNILSYHDVTEYINNNINRNNDNNSSNSQHNNFPPSQKQIDFLHSIEKSKNVTFEGDINNRHDVMKFLDEHTSKTPTEKQMKLISIIESRLNIKFEGSSFKEACEFINNNKDNLGENNSNSSGGNDQPKEKKEVSQKMKDFVKLIENKLGIPYTGSRTSFAKVSEFINTYKQQALNS